MTALRVTQACKAGQALLSLLQRHGVSDVDVAGPDMRVQWQESLAAQPAIDVALSLHMVRSEGLAFTWQAMLRARSIDEPAPAQMDGAQAWLVSGISGGLDSVEYRLRRQGAGT